MLYISRHISPSTYGVVDTDDGVESEVSAGDLMELVGLLDIKGVERARNQDGSPITFGGNALLKEVRPYQPVETKSVQQMKLQMLSHIEVVTYGSIISCIYWKPYEVHRPVSIRLSDFGAECAGFMLFNNRSCDKHICTLILDDKLSFSKDTFLRRGGTGELGVGPNGLGVKLNLKELYNREKAQAIYSWLLQMDKNRVWHYIEDSKTRMAHFSEVL